MKKLLFILDPHSIVDVITNSSSELFVGIFNTKDIVSNLVKEVYPNYLSEYEEIKNTEELSNSELNTYISYKYNYWSNYHQKFVVEVLSGFTEDDMYDERGYFKYDFVNDKNRERVIDSIDPKRKMYFMFSKNQNPNWDYQEKISTFMKRYHLG